MLRKLALLVVVAGVVFMGACGGDDDDGGGGGGGATEVELVAADFAFDPTTLEVPAGEEVTVTFTNDDDTEHSFTVEDLDVETEAEGGESSEVTFTAPDEGTTGFICKYHPDQMTGEITVSGG